MPIQPKARLFVWPDPERFISLVGKAREQGVEIEPIAGFASLMRASSGTTADTFYFVDEFWCSCRAGRHNDLCKHRALYIFENLTRIKDDHGLPNWKRGGQRVVAMT